MERNKFFYIIKIASCPKALTQHDGFIQGVDECLDYVSPEVYLTPATSGTATPNHLIKGDGLFIYSKTGHKVLTFFIFLKDLVCPH